MRYIMQSLLAWLADFFCLLFAVGFLFAPVFLAWIHTPAELHANAVGYLRIYCISFASMFVYNMGSGVLRAVGDSRSPLYAQLAGGLVNVAADYFLIRIMANGVFGVALATLFFSDSCGSYDVVSSA